MISNLGNNCGVRGSAEQLWDEGVYETFVPFLLQYVRETETLVEQQTTQGSFVCDHAGLVTNQSSLSQEWRKRGPGHEG